MNQKRPNIHIIKNTEGDITYEVHRKVKSIQKLRKLIHTKQEKEMNIKQQEPTTVSWLKDMITEFKYRTNQTE